MPFGYDAYVAISEVHEQFQRHLPPERLVRIPNGVRLSDFGRQMRRAGQPVTIAMLSRLAPGKFPRRLLEYVAPLAGLDARVIIAGFGSRRFEIEPEISRRGLGKVVSFIGPIPNAQVHRFLREADIGLHLTETHVELCSMSILEMMASGLPIVAEPKGCLTEMIVHGDNGFLAMDEGEIAGYLRELIASPELRQRMGEASMAVAERYDFARFRASLLELVDGVPRTSIQDTSAGAPGRSPARIVRRAARTGATSGRPQIEVWRPAISYLVCATPRSGSNLLCESMTNTGLAGRPNEFFIRHTDWWSLPEWGETKDIEQYLAWLFEDRSTPNAVFGAKIMMNHFVELVEELRKLPGRARLSADARLQSVFPGLRYVWITRRDKLRQAISRLRADQTARWWRHQGDLDLPVPEPRFNRKEIERRLEEIRIQETEWQTFFDASGTEPVVVVYEDLVGNYEATAKRVARELGIVVPRKVWFGERQLLSQSDAKTDQWVERFKR
jgi:LPS sulfotransferase NodH